MIIKDTPNLTKSQKTEVFDNLYEDSCPSVNFFLLLFLSAAIVTCGLLMDASSIVIGGMLIAPMLWPTLSLAMGIVVGDFILIKKAGLVVLKAALLMFFISSLIAIFFLEKQINWEIMSRTQYFIAYFFVALFSGIAASYAFSHPRLASILPGVAISVALIPPLAVTGIAVSILSWSILVKALGIFLVNLFGIIFGALLVFSMLHFHDISKTIEKKMEEEVKKEEEESREKEKQDIKQIEKTVKQVSAILKEKKKEIKEDDKEK